MAPSIGVRKWRVILEKYLPTRKSMAKFNLIIFQSELNSFHKSWRTSADTSREELQAGIPSQLTQLRSAGRPSANWKRKLQTTTELNALHRNVSFLNITVTVIADG